MSNYLDMNFAIKRFRRIFTSLLTIAFVLAVFADSQAQVTTVAYEGFNYANGASLNGQTGGTGWTSAWTNDYTSGGTLNVSGTGMTYTGLTASGGSAVWADGGNHISEDSRSLPLENSGVVYLQFISQYTSGSGGGTPNIRLFNSGALTGGIGGNGASTMSILNSSLSPNGTTSSSAALLSAVNFVIVRIDYQNDDTEMWVNPNLGAFNYQNPTATPDATYASLAPVFNDIGIYTRNNANVDEISILAVPEPTTMTLLGLSICVVFWKARRSERR
jgi:hypothetical protein